MGEEVFRLPDLGEGLTEAQLVKWRVETGQPVEVNAPLCEVETAKAVVVIPSPFAGKVSQLHARPGETVPVGSPLITIATTTQATEAPSEGMLVGYGPRVDEAAPRRRPRVQGQAAAPQTSGEPRAAPFVRQLAREMGVNLASIRGTGPDGRITRADVEAAAGAPQKAEPTIASTDGEERISVVGLRKAIARQMVKSVSTIPQFTEFAIFDATNLMEARQRAKASGASLTPLPYFVRALARAIKQHPLLNSSWDEERDEIVIKKAINIGIAVNTEKGLLVPVIKQADALQLDQLAERSTRLIEGARAGSLGPTEMSGGTITLTNVGASGPIETGTPIINPPECCVVGIGGIRKRALVVDGEVAAKDSAWISISVDHRIVDGALATEFLTTLVKLLEGVDGS
jgi:pyruvate dehydrogenase E2 component (dihydrolipoamide acetyltransferase)